MIKKYSYVLIIFLNNVITKIWLSMSNRWNDRIGKWFQKSVL